MTGGLFAGDTYLIYGPTGSGKTTFAAGFLDTGARAGENVAMVTQRAPASVLRHAETMGYDFEAHCRAGRMVLLEYPEEIYENSARILTDSRIIEEFRAAVGDEVRRVVLDPVTPLLSNQNAFQVARAKAIAEAFGRLGATTLLLVDTPQGADCLSACSKAAQGVLRFESSPIANVPNVMVLERFPHMEGRQPQLYFDISPGLGMVEQQGRLLPPASGSQKRPSRPATIGASRSELTVTETFAGTLGRGDVSDARILVIHPERQTREVLHSLLGEDYRLLEASGAADGFARVGSETPDLIILGSETRGVSAAEFSRKLRHSGWNMPLMLIGQRLNRRVDRIRALEAGVDVCLGLPLDGRVMITQVRSLLRRRTLTRLASIPLVDPADSLAPEWEDEGVRCTDDPEYFRRRLALALEYRERCNAPFTLAFLKPPVGSRDVHELAAVAAIVARGPDVVLLGRKGAALLLPECDSFTPYFDRLKVRWPVGNAPLVEVADVDELTTADSALDTVLLKVGGVSERMAAVAG